MRAPKQESLADIAQMCLTSHFSSHSRDPLAMKPRPQVIVVIGMHRSGTSAITRGLKALGVDLGSNFAPGVPEDNAKGFWEDRDIVALNQEVLSGLGHDWDVIEPIPAERFSDASLDTLRASAREMLAAKTAATAVFGLKDPRISRLLPFWKPVFASLGLDVGYVVTLRHPASVSRSLQKRDGFLPAKSYLLWLSYMTSAMQNCGDRAVVVDYDAMMDDPAGQLARIARYLDLALPQEASAELAEYRHEFLDGTLRHTRFTSDDLAANSGVHPFVQEAYQILAGLACAREEAIPDAVRARFRDFAVFLGGAPSRFDRDAALRQRDAAMAERGAALAARDAAVAERDAAMAERDAAIAGRDAAMAMIESMSSSVSWRITRPLRLAARVARQGLVDEDRRRLGQELRTFYHRLPLPASARKTLRWACNQFLGTPYQVIRRRILARKGFRPPSMQAAGQQGSVPDYIVWGVIDWHFRRQRPQHLARELAASGRRVFYVSACMVDDARPGFALEALDGHGRLFQIKLHAKGAPVIYSSAPAVEIVSQLRASIGELLAWSDSRQIVSLVQHPFWYDIATVLPNARVVYDCMDHHGGFGNTATDILSLERALLRDAGLTVTTSAWLDQLVSEAATRRVLIRNAGDFEHFAHQPATIYRDPRGRRIIGYYGAIAQWFDHDLVAAVAKRFPDCCISLVGADTANVRSRLKELPNVDFHGEVPYAELPRYLHGFDVCLLPFKRTPLTLATNPVKVYEYLSAGKAVVSTDLPEMRQIADLVRVAGSAGEFLAAVRDALDHPDAQTDQDDRQAFARTQTWAHRAAALIAHAEGGNEDPPVSVVVVTYNNLELTRACLQSLDEHSDYSPLEIIVVDNASADGTGEFLSEWATCAPNRHAILNGDNRGFAAANNQGLAAAGGEYLVLLNNDTYVTPGWLRTLVGHLKRDRSIGLIGPVTNNIGNEAKIDIDYRDMGAMLRSSAQYTRRRVGQTFPLQTAAFFCAMMPRDTYERVGPLDEAFGRGFFEDDDYCRRVERLGLRIACAEDVFVHHHLSASFGKLDNHERKALFEQNRTLYEAKWGKWIPHSYGKPDAFPAPEVFKGLRYLPGRCNVCGKVSRFYYADAALWRESLACEHCRTTSRYRSITRGLLRAISELRGVEAPSLAALPRTGVRPGLRVHDTQPPFYCEPCAYPLPDLLKAADWIHVGMSQYKPRRPLGERLAAGVTNQTLEALTFGDASLDVLITSDVMEHVRLDDRAHREIHRVLRPGGIYIFTVPHNRAWEQTLTRVQVTDPADASKDVHLLEPEYHGDTNSDTGTGALAYRTYGRDIEARLSELGFEVDYSRGAIPEHAIMNAELYYCRKSVVDEVAEGIGR